MSDSGSDSSPEQSGSNTPSMPESGTATPSTMGTGSKKFDFLLQQTELFSHFMGTSQKVRTLYNISNLCSFIGSGPASIFMHS